MDICEQYRWVVEVTGASGAKLGDYSLVDIDFEPAVQWAHLQALRRRTRRAPHARLAAAPAPAQIEPLPCPERGAPYVGGFEVRFADDPDDQCGTQFPRTLLHDDVVRCSSSLVRQGLLRPGEKFSYQICAFPQVSAARRDADFALEAVDLALAVPTTALPEDCQVRGTGWDDSDLPVVVAQRVLDEALDLAAAAGDLETGGLLLGRLCRDRQTDDLFLDVSALISAPGSIGTETSLRFSPETFAAVEQALALRDRGEDMVGWWHSHPHFCANCSVEERRLCVYARPFFSQADRDVHRTLFPKAHSQALLISNLGVEQPSVDLFGWRNGSIQPRGFYAGIHAAIHAAIAPESPPDRLGTGDT